MGFERLRFSKEWTNPGDFPAVETNETKVREDMQILHNETRDALNALMEDLESGDKDKLLRYSGTGLKYLRLNAAGALEVSADGKTFVPAVSNEVKQMHQAAVDDGFDGSEAEFLASLVSLLEHNHEGEYIRPYAVELTGSPGVGHGGYIDFHYERADGDFSTRLIEAGPGKLNMKVESLPGYDFPVFTGYNKPRGSYTGNGESAPRTVPTSGIGHWIILWNEFGFALVGPGGGMICARGEFSWASEEQVRCEDGVLYLATTIPVLNGSGSTISYQVM